MDINEKALEFAVGYFLSDWDRDIPNDELLKSMYEGSEEETDHILPWEPFEYYPLNWIAEHIESLAISLTGEDFR